MVERPLTQCEASAGAGSRVSFSPGRGARGWNRLKGVPTTRVRYPGTRANARRRDRLPVCNNGAAAFDPITHGGREEKSQISRMRHQNGGMSQRHERWPMHIRETVINLPPWGEHAVGVMLLDAEAHE